MKKITQLFSTVALLAACLICSGQCTINTLDSTPGFTPTSLPCITPNVAYGEAQSLFAPHIVPGSGGAILDSAVITGISGLPFGIFATINPASGKVLGNQQACIWFNGTTTVTSGTFPLTINGTIYSSAGTYPLSLVLHDTVTICAQGNQQNSPVAVTLGHDRTVNGSYNFNFYGAINCKNNLNQYWFVYSTDSTFATSNSTPAKTLTAGDSLTVVYGSAQNLSPATTYYYYLTKLSVQGQVYADTLSFYSDTLSPLFEIYGADVYPDPSYGNVASLNGLVAGFPNSIVLQFQWGQNPASLDSITSPDTLAANQHRNIQASVSNLTTAGTYYYRMVGVTGGTTIYSDIRPFFIGYPYTNLQALPASSITTSTADLNGIVQGFNVPVKLDVEYGILFDGYKSPLVYVQNDTPVYNYSYMATGLQRTSLYDYRLRAESWLGNFYGQGTGNGVLFITQNKDSVCQTLPVSGLGLTSATLNGFIDNISIEVTGGFEYGTTTALGSYVQIDTVTTNSSYFPALSLSGLQPHTTYYYCLRVGYPGNGNFIGGPWVYGDTLSFTTGDVGINNTAATGEVVIYPNPANAFIHLAYNGNDLSYLKICDIGGREVMSQTISTGNNVNVSKLEPGIYFVQTFNKAGEKICLNRFVKQ